MAPLELTDAELQADLNSTNPEVRRVAQQIERLRRSDKTPKGDPGHTPKPVAKKSVKSQCSVQQFVAHVFHRPLFPPRIR